MPYVTVPRDLSNVKNKIAMGLTKRQLIAVGTALIICIPLYMLTMKPLGGLAIYVTVIPAIPCFMFGFFNAPDGSPLEKVLSNYIKVHYKQPMTRPYQTQNIYANLAVMQQIKEIMEKYEGAEHDSNDNNKKD